MRTELRNSLSQKKTLLIISLLSILLGLLSCIFGDVIQPLLIACLAALYLFDSKATKAHSIVVSLVLLGLNAASILLGVTISFFAPCAIILALILCIAYTKELCKADTAYIMMVISAAFTVASCAFLAMMEQGEYSLAAVTAFYGDLHDSFRTLFISSMSEMYKAYAAAGIEVTEDMVALVFDSIVKQLISFLLIGGFMIVGLSMKAFGFAVSRLSENKRHITEWRFTATNIFAYFYLILIFASLFVSSADGVIAIAVLNLYNLVLVIFAYVGFNIAMNMLMTRMKAAASFIVLIIVLLLLSSFAMQVLAVMGVMSTLRSGRQTNRPLNP